MGGSSRTPRSPDLSPAGAVLYSESGTDTLPYREWPRSLRERYGYDPLELAKYIENGIDGIYAHHESLAAFEGEVLQLEHGRYVYRTFSDLAVVGEKPRVPISGDYHLDGWWVIFDNPSMPAPARIIAVIEGRLVILAPQEFMRWKDTKKLTVGLGLWRREVEQLQRKPAQR